MTAKAQQHNFNENWNKDEAQVTQTGAASETPKPVAALQSIMKASELNSLINGISTGEDLKQAIQSEVSSYAELMKKRGSGITLIFDEMKKSLSTIRQFKNFCMKLFRKVEQCGFGLHLRLSNIG